MIHEIYGLLKQSLCDEIVNYFETVDKRNFSQYTDFFKNRTLLLNQIEDFKIRKQIKLFHDKLSQELYLQYGKYVFVEFCDIVKWFPEMEMNIHTDNQNNFDRHRDYTSILYLNDDYSGGETFLPDHNVICPAEKGKLLVFPSSYPHGVNRIKNKCRYTLMTWFTEDENFSLMT